MGILKRIQDRWQSVLASSLGSEQLSLSAALPGSRGEPLWQMRVEMATEPHADGERLRLRVHFRTRLRKALPGRRDENCSRVLAPAERVGRRLERWLALPLVRTLAAPLLDRDFNTWLELQASTAALDEGAKELLPARLADLGIHPSGNQPVETWIGAIGGARPGFAQVTLMHLDKKHLPPTLAEALGPQPFQLAAAMVNVVEET